MSSYDDWKTETPEDEHQREGALWRRFRRRWGKSWTDRDPDDARDAQQDRETRGED